MSGKNFMTREEADKLWTDKCYPAIKHKYEDDGRTCSFAERFSGLVEYYEILHLNKKISDEQLKEWKSDVENNGYAYPEYHFTKEFLNIQKKAHATAVEKGWWEKDAGDAVAIANMHGELSEAWEWIRKGNPKSDHIPEFSGVEEEFADVIIRMMDTAEKRGYRIAEAIIAKMEFNKTRTHRHGGKKY